MKGEKKVLYAGGLLLLVVAIAAVLTMGAASSDQGQGTQKDEVISEGIPSPLLPTTYSYVYSAKYICGPGGGSMGAVVPGSYLTAINIHNPQMFNVTLTKKVVQSIGEDYPPIPPSLKRTYKIQPDYAFEINCKDIYGIGRITTPFSKGFVVLETPYQLDVVGVYTSLVVNTTGYPLSNTLEVETVRPKQIILSKPTVAADLPID